MNMYAPLLRSILLRDRQRKLAESSKGYLAELGRDRIEQAQVDRFNAVWAYCLEEIPFYSSWAREYDLPPRISSLADLRQFPALTKSVIVQRGSEIFQNGRITNAYSTAGTSGTPARYPSGEHDVLGYYTTTYTGRGWWGIRPFDSYLHIWGHAHLFGGSGIKGKIQKAKRKVQDILANATRVSSYDMSKDGLRSDYHALTRSNPSYIVGATSAVFKLARFIESNSSSLAGLTKLKSVVVTAETVTQADVDVISRVFGVPVVIEYGSAETGVMATSRGGSWPLQVQWQGFILSVADDGDVSVTTLNERLFPLINYSIGDRVEGGDIVDGNALTLGAVTGRSQDVVTVSTLDGEHLELSAVLPVHLLKSEPGVSSVQLRQEAPGVLRIFLSADRPLPLRDVAEAFTSQMKREHSMFDPVSVSFEQIQEPLLTKAGKQALFV
ncbi:hypothetical protein [Arthrobacter sp. W4I7]|uniref:hypothetical protein n=1 Tax=Arthrobacter sp. W4I7 TaxID=3042296 RepID=UPI00277D178D|nr:hypothetical protein [Arthrobacter sp. W4I7]MDQ0689856.1 phenylacetate-CoA ligase [Arthrobacter sp. W4I7]